MSISAALVMELRKISGAGMMDCKKALLETHGDLELALVEMRKKGQAKAAKKADRVAAEGVIEIARSADGRDVIMLEINSETDFVARDLNFTDFASKAALTALQSGVEDVQALSAEMLSGTELTVEQAREELVAKIGENIQLRRLSRLHSDDVTGFYLHGGRIGVLVALQGGDESLAKDLAMHIAASRPQVISSDQMDPVLIENERAIFMAQVLESGKPPAILEKMVEGRIAKFLDEVCLSGQAFVKDPALTIAALLKQKNAKVLAFTRYEVGEGIEKKQDNFVEEVMAQVHEK